MKVLILGAGGREHALGWAISREDPDGEILFSPGNGGTDLPQASGEGEGSDEGGGDGGPRPKRGRNVPGDLSDLPSLVELARAERVDFTLVGPEAPLAAGIVDLFSEAGLPIFGPTARAAALEGSKVFSKTLLRELGVPTAPFEVFTTLAEACTAAARGEFPKVIKADGLAAGKGVVIARDAEEAVAAVRAIMGERRFGGAGDRLIIESFLRGEEVSVFALVRGEEFRLLPFSQDHKRLLDGDTGPNTGGMGAIAPYPRTRPELLHAVGEEIFAPVLRAMAGRGAPVSGLLYAGLIMVNGRPQVLEFNCRFGDPETQAVLPLLGSGFLSALEAVARGIGPLPEIPFRGGAAATVVLVSGGYPDSYRIGLPITGWERAARLPGVLLFHAGTRRVGGQLVTAGGRVLAVTSRGAHLREALDRAYAACSLIEFEGKTYRRDIGQKALS